MTNHSRTIQDIFEGRMRFLPQVHRHLANYDKENPKRKVPEIVIKAIVMASSGGSHYFCGNCGDIQIQAEVFAHEFNCISQTVKLAFTVTDVEGKSRIVRFRLEPRFLMKAKERHRNNELKIGEAILAAARIGMYDLPTAFGYESVIKMKGEYFRDFVKDDLGQAMCAIDELDALWQSSNENLLNSSTEWFELIKHPEPVTAAMNCIKHFNRLKASGHTLDT